MAEDDPIGRHPDFAPTHPGEILREEILPALAMSAAEAAHHLGIPRQALEGVLAGTSAVTPEIALRVGTFCGNGPDIWLRMQNAYDLFHMERALRSELARIPTPRAA